MDVGYIFDKYKNDLNGAFLFEYFPLHLIIQHILSVDENVSMDYENIFYGEVESRVPANLHSEIPWDQINALVESIIESLYPKIYELVKIMGVNGDHTYMFASWVDSNTIMLMRSDVIMPLINNVNTGYNFLEEIVDKSVSTYFGGISDARKRY